MTTADYASFLVRCWRTPDGDQRIVIEHVQSGERAAVPSLGAAAARIAAWLDGAQAVESRTDGGASAMPDPPGSG